jgi:UPF0755 protein
MLVIKKQKKSLKFVSILFAVLVSVFSVAAFATRTWYVRSLRPVSSSEDFKSIVIESGMGPGQIASLLEAEGLISSSRAFRTYVRGREASSSLKAGTYRLSPSMSVQGIVSSIVGGDVSDKSVTIGPGLRLDQIKDRLVGAGFSMSEVESSMDPLQYVDIPVVSGLKKGSSLEGYLYPETFKFAEGTRPHDVIRLSLTELNSVINSEMVVAYSANNLTLYEAITLASIVEKEVPSPSDRQKVAQVFLKRLAEGIPLGSDATYYYASAVFGGDPFPDLDSPYNTRIYEGLPPGPINNVSRSALEAVAFPSKTDYLFFVTGDDGVNYFTSTQQEHEAAVAKHCLITCARGYVPDN